MIHIRIASNPQVLSAANLFVGSAVRMGGIFPRLPGFKLASADGSYLGVAWGEIEVCAPPAWAITTALVKYNGGRA